MSRDGGLLVVGWVDDQLDLVSKLTISCGEWRASLEASNFGRVRRPDVEAAIKCNVKYSYGYLGIKFTASPLTAAGPCQVEILFSSGMKMSARTTAHLVDLEQLRDTCLSYLIGSTYYGNAQIRAMACLESGVGHELLVINRRIVGTFLASPYIAHFGDRTRRVTSSIIVCLFGRAEYIFLQCALYSRLSGIEHYELIYVLNSPELSDRVLSEAQIASCIYEIPMTIVILAGNAGFSGANNAGVAAARTDRIVIVNPDVFPKDPNWAQKHSQIVTSRPKRETEIFGVPLYYDDGSLMHGGMYFKMDRGVTVESGRNLTWQLLKVEHFGKGSQPEENPYLSSRAVPAVTGAFISCRRGWFDNLGGFSIDYIFGHYEDADLCLKSLEAGVAPWIHHIEMWHLEGKGSIRLPVHEGGALVNRWGFTSRWGTFVSTGLLGSAPSHPSLGAN